MFFFIGDLADWNLNGGVRGGDCKLFRMQKMIAVDRMLEGLMWKMLELPYQWRVRGVI